MKVEIDITEQEIKDLKLIRDYFGGHDKTMLEHLVYSQLDKLVKKLTPPVGMDCSTCKHMEVSEHVEPCYGCRDNDSYDNYESAIVP